MKQAIDKIIHNVLERREARQDNPVDAQERHEHSNEIFRHFCNGTLLPLLMEARQALLAHQIPAEVKLNPQIGFTTVDGIVLVVATHEFKGTNLMSSSNRVFISFELDADDVSLHIQVGGNNIILANFPPQTLPISEESVPQIEHTVQEVIREAATVYFKV